MASNLKLKNNIETEFSITHKDNAPAKSLDTDDLTYTRATVADMEAISNPQDGDVCFVKDLDRGGSFIYDSSEVGNDNQGTNFNGWIRQYSGAVYPKWFGCIPDIDDATTATNNTAILQNIINYFQDIQIDGNYYINNTLTMDALVHITSIHRDYELIVSSTITANMTVLKFNGTNRTQLKDLNISGNIDAHAYDVIGIEITTNGTNDVYYCDFVGVTVHACTNALGFTSATVAHSNIRFDRCRFRDSQGVNGNVFIGCEVQQIQFDNCNIRTAKTSALGSIVIATPSTTRLTFNDCLIDDNENGAHGVYITQASGAPILFNGCEISYNNGSGIYVDLATGAASLNISGCTFRLNGGKGIFLDGSSATANIDGCWITDNGQEGVRTLNGRVNIVGCSLDYNSIGVLLQNSNDSYIASNKIEYSELNGIFLQNADRANVQGNSFNENGTSADVTYDHVQITTGTDRATINGNSFYKGVNTNKTRYAININSGATNTYAIYNKVESGGQIGTVLDNGTTSNVTGNL